MTATADTPAVTASPTPMGSDFPPTPITPAEARAMIDGLRADDVARAATVQTALDYVADTRELRTPVERTLADEVILLRRICDEEALDHAHLINQCGAVLDHWVDDEAGAPVHRKRDRLRALVRGYAFDGSRLASELDELGEHLGRAAS